MMSRQAFGPVFRSLWRPVLGRAFQPARFYSAGSVGAEPVVASTAGAAASSARSTLKKPESRKTYLMDVYTHVVRTNPILLVLHNSTLLKNEDKALRADVRKAGGQLLIVRSNLFKATLRGLEHADPASAEAHSQFKKTRHPLSPLFNGPTAVIAIPELNPKTVDSIVSLVDKSNNRLILLGGQVNGSVLNQPEIQQFRKMPSLDELRAQLAGVLTVLGGAGLTSTLEASSKMLYLTLDQHKKSMQD